MDFNSLSCFRELAQVSFLFQFPVKSAGGGAGVMVVVLMLTVLWVMVSGTFVWFSNPFSFLVVFLRYFPSAPNLHFSRMEGDNVITEYWL